MKVRCALVTGAAGWLGTHLVRALSGGLPDTPSLAGIDGPNDIRCLVGPGDDETRIAGIPRARIFRGDVTRPASLAEFCAGARDAVVFHCAGVIHPSLFTAALHRVNVDGTANLLRSAIDAGARRFVHVSSNSPFGFNAGLGDRFDESSPYAPYRAYGRTKRAAEDLVFEASASGRIEATIVRPPWFYGPGQPARQTLFFRMVREGRFPIVGDGGNFRSMAYLDNLCQGLLLAAVRDAATGRAWWIADRRPYPMTEIVGTVETVLREDFGLAVSDRRLTLPGFIGPVARAADATLQALGLYSQKVHVLSEMDRDIACALDGAAAALGYDPRVELREGMRRSIRWALDHGARI